MLLSIPFILLGVGLVIWAVMSRPRQHWTFPEDKFAEELETVLAPLTNVKTHLYSINPSIAL